MPDFKVSVTICSWNTQSDLRDCLRSLEALGGHTVLEGRSIGVLEEEEETAKGHPAKEAPATTQYSILNTGPEGAFPTGSGGVSFEVLVVDNNSRDGSPDMVEREFPWVRLFRMDRNLGFTGGHNFALGHIRGQHAFLLNSDTIVHPGALEELVEFLEADPQRGIVAPKLLNPDGSLQYSARRFPNPVAAMFRNTFLGRLFPKNRYTRDYLMQDWDHSSSREVDWVSGAAFLVRDEVMAKVGLFDPAYFMYCEDVDWCWRTWKHGYKVVYDPKAVVTHAIGRSTDRVANKMILRFHVSMLRFYRKNMLPEMNPFWRPSSYVLATAALTARAMLFILKNALDAVKRRLRKSG
jgi:GT2 family glycosyltransferase